MSKFSVIPKSGSGSPKYSGTPTFTGTYMKPGVLEFREVASPVPIDWEPGDYVIYSRTGNLTYRLYNVPQLKKQSRSNTYGGAYIYQGVQFFDDSKQLEFCPFRDLVKGDNRIHFSTQPSISTFEAVDGIARRLEACLVDMYGANSWAVRVATESENPAIYPLVQEAREFTVSGVNLLEALDKVYEVWPEVGWVFKVENGKNTIVIGGGGISSTSSFLYGKGNGLLSITRNVANADELANRIFPYGANRNMLPRWYNSQDIKDADSVDIQNLMLPVEAIPSLDWLGWGTTEVDGEPLPDAAKAFVEDEASILRLGLRPTTVYFDGSGEYPAIYPSIRETTIRMVRVALGDSTAKYYPSTTVYADDTQRIDRVLSAQSTFDSGLAGGSDGKSSLVSDYEDISTSGSKTVNAGAGRKDELFSKTITATETGKMNLSASFNLTGIVGASGAVSDAIKVTIELAIYVNGVGGQHQQSIPLTQTIPGQWELASGSVSETGIAVRSGDTVSWDAKLVVNNYDGTVAFSYTYSAIGSCSFRQSLYRERSFEISVRQVGFDIGAQADLGEGKTIAMRSGKCAGRSFAIKSVQYIESTDSWTLECWRSEDESLSQWFPNTDYPIRGLENAGQQNEYPGDEFVLLDIAMPDIYVQMAEIKLLQAARELLADTATERWQYTPEIDAKFMVENSRTITAGQNMTLQDADVIGNSPVSVLVDSLTINEGESNIPTYKVTLRDRKRKTWTESEAAQGSSSKSVAGTTEATSQSASQAVRAESFFEAKTDPVDSSRQYIQLKSQYTGLSALGWIADGGVGQNGGGGGGGGLITSVKSISDLGTPIATESLSETFSAKAIESIYETLQQKSKVEISNILPQATGRTRVATLTIDGTNYDIFSPEPSGGGVSTETDPVFSASAAFGISASDIANWNAKSDFSGSYNDLTDKPTIPAAQVNSDWDAVSGVAQILNKPSIPTESTVSGWGFTKNAGTITGVTMNGVSKGTSGVVDLGTVITEHQSLADYALKVGGSDYNFLVNTLKLYTGSATTSGHLSSGSYGSINPKQRPKWTYTYRDSHFVDHTENNWIAYLSDIPASLKNPYSLTFGSKTYDGSAAKEITASDLGALTAHQTIYALTLRAGSFSTGTYTPNSAAATVNIPTTLDHISDGSTRKLSDYVTLSGTQTITGAKTFSAQLTASNGISLTGDIVPSADLGPSIGYSTRRVANINARTYSAQEIHFKLSSDATKNSGYLGFANGWMMLRTSISGIDTSDASTFKQITFHQTYGFYPEAAGVNLGYNGANYRWANIYGVNGNLSGDLSLASTSHIDIGPLRLEYDATNKALHITKVDSNDNTEYGIYADGFVGDGGIQSS